MESVKNVSFELARHKLPFDEPIPEFSSRFPNILESCIATPFQKFNNKDLYKGLIDKAAILFYLLIKNHPFQNGNKRIAVTTLLIFLSLNKKWIYVTTVKFYKFAVQIAESDRELKVENIKMIEQFIKDNIKDY